MPSDPSPPEGGIAATSEFVRHRNALLSRARLADLYLDYYLHLADNQVQLAPEHDALLKRLLAVAVLHCMSRPRNEIIAWTVNLQEPLVNLFASGDNGLGHLTGRLFTDHVRKGGGNLLYVETARARDPVRRSAIDFDGNDLFAAAERFYERSEQRPARLFDLGDEEFALLSAHPDCDLAWLRGVDVDAVRSLADRETLVPMERRPYRWKCGCDERRIFRILAPAMRADPEDLFHGEEALRMECPRCGGLYRISREALEAYIAAPDA